MKYKKILPKREDIEKSKFFNFLIKKEKKYEFLFHFDKENINRGISIGIFSAFIVIPIQSIIAIILCFIFRANVLVAIPTTLISNPLTYVPLYYSSYKTGMFLTFNFFKIDLENDSKLIIIFINLYNFIIPTLIGGIFLGIISGYLFYLVLKLINKIKK